MKKTLLILEYVCLVLGVCLAIVGIVLICGGARIANAVVTGIVVVFSVVLLICSRVIFRVRKNKFEQAEVTRPENSDVKNENQGENNEK